MSKYEFSLEFKSLKSNEDKKKNKEQSNSILNNKRLRNKNSNQNESMTPNEIAPTSQVVVVEQPVLNNNTNTSTQTNIIPVTQASVGPVILSPNYSVLLEPIRNDTTSQLLITSEQKTSQVNNHKDIFIDSAQSLDPFNDCELKTINDFEELKSILNNHQLEQQQQLQKQQMQFQQLQLQQQSAQNFLPTSNSKSCPVDSFGLPIVDLDINSNKIK